MDHFHGIDLTSPLTSKHIDSNTASEGAADSILQKIKDEHNSLKEEDGGSSSNLRGGN
jgi:hypothetical protein